MLLEFSQRNQNRWNYGRIPREKEEQQKKRIGENFRFLKTAKEEAFAEEMRNKATEGLGAEKKKRAGDDQPRKKRKQTPNETINYLAEATEKEWELKKNEVLEFRKKQTKRWHKNSTTAVPDDVSNVYAATTDKAKHYLNSWKRDIEFTKLIFCCFYYTSKARFSIRLCRLVNFTRKLAFGTEKAFYYDLYWNSYTAVTRDETKQGHVRLHGTNHFNQNRFWLKLPWEHFSNRFWLKRVCDWVS